MKKTLARKTPKFWGAPSFNVFVWLLLAVYLLPVAFMIVTAFMSTEQLEDERNTPLYPAKVVHFLYKGQDLKVYNVPTTNGVKQWALISPQIKPRDPGLMPAAENPPPDIKTGQFVDPQHPEAGVIAWRGDWNLLTASYEFSLAWDNFTVHAKALPIPRLFGNTLFMVIVTEIGVLLSSIVVAYGFARFPLPGGNLLFYILIATILIPEKITFLPTYFFYVAVPHWAGTMYPLIVPYFFGNAVYIFLLRQNFKGLPFDLEEAAMIDGAGPLRRLYSVVLPQSWAVIITVSILHFFYIWNETRQASIYLSTAKDLMPISFGMQLYQSLHPIQNVIEAFTILALAVPLILLFLSQRFFLQGILITGTENK